MKLSSLVPHVRGRVPVPPGNNGRAVLARVMRDLQGRECQVRLDGSDRLVLDSGTAARYSPLALVDGGEIRLLADAGGTVLHYDLSTRTVFLFCAAASLVCAALAWFGLGSGWLAVFGLVAPVLWLYGANYAVTCVRVPGLLRHLSLDAARNDEA